MRTLSRLVVLFSVLFAACTAFAQSHAPSLGEKPFQSVSDGGIDTVNFENGGLLVHIPLLSLPQLGKLKTTFSLTGNGPQYVQSAYCDGGGNCEYGYTHYNPCMDGNTYLGDDGSSSIALEWDQWHTVCGLYHVILISAPVDSAGQDNPSASYDAFYDFDDNTWYGDGPTNEMSMQPPVYEQWNEFKVIDANGADHIFGYDPNDYARLKTNDGSGYVLDMGGTRTGLQNAMAGPGDTYAIVDPNGTRQIFSRSGLAPSGAMAMKDTNGNQITWNYLTGVTDSIGRQFIYDPYPDASDAPTGCPSLTGQPTADSSKTWTVTDNQGHALISYKLCYTSISIATNFFSGGAGNTSSWCEWSNDSAGDPISQCYYYEDFVTIDEKLQSVILPNNTYWGFGYSQPDSNGVNYGDLSSIKLPSGGELRYTFDNVPACGIISGEEGTPLGRVLKSRTVYPIVGAPQTTSYQYTQFLYAGSQDSIIETDLAGNDTVHILQPLNYWQCQFADSDTKFYQGSRQNGQLLKEVTRSYSVRNSPQQMVQNLLVNEPGPITTQKILNSENTTQNGSLVSIDSKGYDNWFNDVQPLLIVTLSGPSIDYIYLLSSNQASIPLNDPTSTSDGIKTTVTTRLAATNPAYAAANLIYLPASVTIRDSASAGVGNPLGTIVAETDYGYDEAGSPQGAIGNNTSVHSFSMMVNDPNSVTTTAYNSFGMPVSTTDSRGNAGETGNHTTLFGYDSTGVFVSQVQRPATDNGQSHISYYGTDPTLGVLLWSSDENSSGPQDSAHTTRYSYDPIGRATSAIYPDGGSTQVCFSDEAITNCPMPGSPPFSVQIIKQTGSGSEISVANYDGVGRVITAGLASTPSLPPYTADESIVDTTYDQLGNVHSVSNPYRPTPNPQTDGLTVYAYDPLHRKTLQQNPDGITTLQWSYSGLTVSETDESNNTWVRTSDIGGRLTQVQEPGSFVTNYTYSALGNLQSVVQDGAAGEIPRSRSFNYDSLSRLLSARNPETGLIGYTYDADGNLSTKTDARGVVTHYSYDSLNRIRSKSFTGDSANTPSACYQYDATTTNGVGRLFASWTQTGTCAGSLPGTGTQSSRTILAYDNMGRIRNEQQCTPGVCNTATQPYSLQYDYDLTGKLTHTGDGIGQASWFESYDSTGRLLGVTAQTLWPIQFYPSQLFTAQEYSAAGGLTNWTMGFNPTGQPALTGVMQYDTRLRVTSETVTGHD